MTDTLGHVLTAALMLGSFAFLTGLIVVGGAHVNKVIEDQDGTYTLTRKVVVGLGAMLGVAVVLGLGSSFFSASRHDLTRKCVSWHYEGENDLEVCDRYVSNGEDPSNLRVFLGIFWQ